MSGIAPPMTDSIMPIKDEDKAMELDHQFLSAMSRRVGGSFYVFEPGRFVKNFNTLTTCFQSHGSNIHVAYALKANYLPAICDLLLHLDGWAEVVSRLELDIARRSLPMSRIVFNGPVKTEDDLKVALHGGCQLNIDSFHEIALLRKLSMSFDDIPVGLRVSFPSSGGCSRFGFDAESGELDDALSVISTIPRVRVITLHCHKTSRALGVQSHVNRVRDLCALALKLQSHHPITTINIGGGLLGNMPAALARQFPFPLPSVEESAHAIGHAFARYRSDSNLSLMVEPGTALVADTMSLVAKVIEVRKRSDGYQVLLDTSINSVNPTRSGILPIVSVVSEGRHPVRTFRAVGHTCMEHDVLIDDLEAGLTPGDFVIFHNRGAYSFNFTPHFIHPIPAVVDNKGNILKNADDVISVTQSHRHYSRAICEGVINEYHADLCRKT